MMQALDALSEITFMPYLTGEDVWCQDAVHVEGLHPEAWNEVERLYSQLKQGRNVSNVVIEGRPGVGKTHFLNRLRAEVMERGDFFVLVELSSAFQFWPSLVSLYLDAFRRENRSGTSQFSTWLASLLKTAGLPRAQCDRAERFEMSPAEIVSFHSALREMLGPGPGARKALDVAIALMLRNCEDFQAQNIGESFLLGFDIEPDDQRHYRFCVRSLPPEEVVKAFDQLIDRAGKVSVVSVDQLDGLINITSKDAPSGGDGGVRLDQIATGLMDLAQYNRRSLIVLSCLRPSWELIKHNAVQSAAARYPIDLRFNGIPTSQVGEALIAAYLKRDFDRVGFISPYPTWPIKGEAFRDAQYYTPRRLIELAEKHIRKCRQTGKIDEMQSFDSVDEGERPSGAPAVSPAPTEIPPQIETTFESAKKRANIEDALDEKRVDSVLPELLRAGLAAWIEENAGEGDFVIDSPPGKNPPLHARLRKVLDPETEAEAHWAFRAVHNQNAVAALNRLRAAVTISGLGLGLAKRKLIILRNSMWSSGPKTSAVLEEYNRLGGRTLLIERDDLAVFSALRDLRQTHGEASIPWLRSVRPASATKLFQTVFNGSAPAALPAAPACNGAKPAIRPAPLATRDEGEPSIPLGTAIESGQRVSLKLEDLRRHAAIFAGSGSGKTVLIRRIIEECALQGVSTIILDPNNDLSRLGTPWPEAPRSWAEGDAEKASRYFSETEVVIWTPRRATGRPLSFRPLADLSAVMADPDEFSIAIDNAVGTIFPRAGLPTTGGKAEQGRAVLNEALRQFVLQRGDGLNKFLNFLSALPEGVSRLANAEKLANDMAQTLIAATVNDPLFGGEGEVVDPGVLLTPKGGKKARISVISLIGLPNDDQRQSFVNQLQMSLFAWAKKNPAGDRPLGGLFVMDEAQTFAPSGSATPCTGSTLALASQARKYGLGLIFATQAPKGLHNRIPGNATTQFYGFLNSPAQITAAREMAAAKGGDVSDISRLTTGQFYIMSDCIALQKVSTPLCLSYHPKSPLTQQEILDLARD